LILLVIEQKNSKNLLFKRYSMSYWLFRTWSRSDWSNDIRQSENEWTDDIL